VGHERGEAVVVAVADVVAGDGVVLVDDRHHPELEQAHQHATGVEVLAAVDEVVGHEQRLRGHQSVRGQRGVPAAHQPRLAGRRQRLQRRGVVRTVLEPERGDAGGDRARRHHEHLVAVGASRRHLGAQLDDGGVVDRAALVGQRRRPDLDDDAHVSPGTRS
jgi:hypothetical protein